VTQRKEIDSLFGTAQRMGGEETLQPKSASASSTQLDQQPVGKPNNTGLPDNLKSGIENLSGMSMDGVKVYYNSSQPAQLNALAYAQGADIHIAPGQEQHLPHEAWHVVQQAQGRVRPTMQMKGGVQVNDDAGLEQEADLMGIRALGSVQLVKQEKVGVLDLIPSPILPSLFTHVTQGMFYESSTESAELVWHWGPVVEMIWKKKNIDGEQAMYKGYGVWERKTNDSSRMELSYTDYLKHQANSILKSAPTLALGYFLLSFLESLPTAMAMEIMPQSNTTNATALATQNVSNMALGPEILALVASNVTIIASLAQYYAMTRASDNATIYQIRSSMPQFLGDQNYQKFLVDTRVKEGSYYNDWKLHELPEGTMERDQQDDLTIPVNVFDLGGVVDVVNSRDALDDGKYIYVLRPDPSKEDGAPQLLIRRAGDGETWMKLAGNAYSDNFRNPQNITERCPDPAGNFGLFTDVVHRLPQRISGCQYERVRHTQLRGPDKEGAGWKGIYCAGELTVKKGKVTDSNNASGHYQPPETCTTRVERTLQEERGDVLAEGFTRRDHKNDPIGV